MSSPGKFGGERNWSMREKARFYLFISFLRKRTELHRSLSDSFFCSWLLTVVTYPDDHFSHIYTSTLTNHGSLLFDMCQKKISMMMKKNKQENPCVQLTLNLLRLVLSLTSKKWMMIRTWWLMLSNFQIIPTHHDRCINNERSIEQTMTISRFLSHWRTR